MDLFPIWGRLQNSGRKEIKIKIILASGSPRRKALLKQIDLDFQVAVSKVHEDFTIDLSPSEFAEYYAREKASDIANRFPEDLVVGADTIVVLDGKILGKPENARESYAMLKSLSGRTHTVITGVSLLNRGFDYTDTFHELTDVTFNQLSQPDIEHYINTYEPFDKAGSYGIQDWFSIHVRKIEGCFYNVVGFPLSRFYNALKKYANTTGEPLF